jgi:hypothetical protein
MTKEVVLPESVKAQLAGVLADKQTLQVEMAKVQRVEDAIIQSTAAFAGIEEFTEIKLSNDGNSIEFTVPTKQAKKKAS